MFLFCGEQFILTRKVIKFPQGIEPWKSSKIFKEKLGMTLGKILNNLNKGRGQQVEMLAIFGTCVG